MGVPLPESTIALEAETATLWRALADPTRRRILDLLSQGPLITGEIAAAFPISRIAVMRHLEVLADAELITSRKRGRERWHYLNAIPLERLHRRWVGPAASGFASGLLRLQDRVETERAVDGSRPAAEIAFDVTIAGRPTAVFTAITENVADWWGFPALDPRATGLSIESELGGRFVEHWAQGGQVLASVTGWERDRYIRLTGPFHFGLALGDATFELQSAPGGTLLAFTFRVVGAIDQEAIEGMKGGWNQLVAIQLKAFVESGSKSGISGGRSNMRAIGDRKPGSTPARPPRRGNKN